MTTADQIVERDGQVNIGGEWHELHPATEPDADWRHRYQAMLNRDTDSYPSDPSSPNLNAERAYGWL